MKRHINSEENQKPVPYRFQPEGRRIFKKATKQEKRKETFSNKMKLLKELKHYISGIKAHKHQGNIILNHGD